MAHYGSARAFAVNPARLKARPAGFGDYARAHLAHQSILSAFSFYLRNVRQAVSGIRVGFLAFLLVCIGPNA
jgi:hypothetical protein